MCCEGMGARKTSDFSFAGWLICVQRESAVAMGGIEDDGHQCLGVGIDIRMGCTKGEVQTCRCDAFEH